jgi:YgiT-type zinc finger domain-containing protein
MQCTLCKVGETNHGLTTVVLHRGDTSLIIKQVPADICTNCGEYYLSESIASRVLHLSEEAVAKGTEVEILRFAA